MTFQERKQALLQRNKTKKKQILPFITQYHPTVNVPKLKEILTRKWYLIQQQPWLNQIFREPPIISYRKARKPNHVFRSRVGPSAHINTYQQILKAYTKYNLFNYSTLDHHEKIKNASSEREEVLWLAVVISPVSTCLIPNFVFYFPIDTLFRN